MSTMSHKIAIFALLAISGFSRGDCLGLCRSKLLLPPLVLPAPAVPALPFGLPLGLPCAEAVSNCGPEPLPLPVIQAPPVTVPTIEGPIIPLPSPPIPCPKTIAHRCICTKTVVKPQLVQRCITVPSVQRYLKRTYTPVVENIAYKAKPKCPPCSCGARAAPVCSCSRPPVCACAARPAPPPPVVVPPPPVPLSLPFSRIC